MALCISLLLADLLKTKCASSDRPFLEFHHVVPYAKGGTTTTENLELRCRAHNVDEAVVMNWASETAR